MSKKKMETEIDPSLLEDALHSVERVTSESKKGNPNSSASAEIEVDLSDEETERQGSESAPEKSDENKDDFKDRFIRLSADFDNFRKRTHKEKGDLIRYGNENLVRELLPILDNFERALEHARQADDVKALQEGVEMIFTQLKTSFERFGVRSESALGKPFDPLIHEAVSHTPSSEHPANSVIEEHQKAYFLHDRLLRPALVTVAKEPGPEEASGPEAETVETTPDSPENMEKLDE